MSNILDFRPDSLIGVHTNFKLVTEVIDLRSGAVLGTVDNSKNYRPTILSTTTSGSLSPAVVVGLAAGLFFAIRGYMRRRRSSS